MNVGQLVKILRKYEENSVIYVEINNSKIAQEIEIIQSEENLKTTFSGDYDDNAEWSELLLRVTISNEHEVS